MDRVTDQQTLTADVDSQQGRLVPARAADKLLQRILVINCKGGCGKSTLATNLAAYFACNNIKVALQDYDPQGSCSQWLKLRDSEAPAIFGVDACRTTSNVTRSFQLRIPVDTQRLIIDAPGGINGQGLIDMVRNADTILIPVLPSPFDIHATSHFIRDLHVVAKIRTSSVRVGVVANRVRANTRIYSAFHNFLESLDIPFVGQLRETQNYPLAANMGLSIHEVEMLRVDKDRKEWEKLIGWISQ